MSTDPNPTANATYYDILEISPSATPDDIQVARRRLAKKWHPDKHMTAKQADRDFAAARYSEVDEAYHVLSDPGIRAQYDQGVFGTAGSGAASTASTSPLVAMVSPEQLIADLEAYFEKYLCVDSGVSLLLVLWT